MNKEIKEIREYIACPQFGDEHYGKWGALTLNQRIKIKQLLDYISNLKEIEQYHHKLNGELREEKEKLEIALQNIQEDFDRVREEYVMLQNAGDSYEDELEEKIEIMQKYFQLIIDLGYDCDGCNTIEELKMLIDELVRYARVGKNCDIVETVYINGLKSYNILGEEIEYKEEKGSDSE